MGCCRRSQRGGTTCFLARTKSGSTWWLTQVKSAGTQWPTHIGRERSSKGEGGARAKVPASSTVTSAAATGSQAVDAETASLPALSFSSLAARDRERKRVEQKHSSSGSVASKRGRTDCQPSKQQDLLQATHTGWTSARREPNVAAEIHPTG